VERSSYLLQSESKGAGHPAPFIHNTDHFDIERTMDKELLA
jgi:hypothetical protein